jgi:GNAT superfamily N-acetyltransferase
MIKTGEPDFRKLDFDGLKQLVRWAEAEGWNPGPYDADIFWATDAEGFYGFYDDELIAGGSIVSYDRKFGFMGFFIVKPELRSQGIGRKLWYLRRDKLLERLLPGAAIGMDGVVAMQPFYERGGFQIAFRDIRYENTGKVFATHPHITPIHLADHADILLYDARCFGVSRPQFMLPWLQMSGSKAFKFSDDNHLLGFALMRKAAAGYKIGPLFADDAAVAEALYQACLNAAIDEKVFLDIPEINSGAKHLVGQYEAVPVFECARMYLGTPPETAAEKVFGITTFELG